MTVVRIPPTLRDATGGEKQVVADGPTVRDVLASLTERFPALGRQILEDGDVAPFVNVYLEGEDVRTREGLDTPVEPGTTLILLPAMAGGSLTSLGGDPSGRQSRPAGRLTPLAAGCVVLGPWPY